MAIAVDTLKFLDTLEKAQVPREQARAIVQIVRESHDSSDVATKGDLRHEIALVRKDMDAMEQRMSARMDAQENRLIIKLSIVMTGLIAFAGAVQVLVGRL